MVEEKQWYRSKTIWGALISVIAAIAGSFGISVDSGTQQDMLAAIVQLTGALGAIIAIYGRLTATDMIT